MKTVAQKKEQKKRSSGKALKSIIKKPKKKQQSSASVVHPNNWNGIQVPPIMEETEHTFITNQDEQRQITNSTSSYNLQGEQNLIRRIRVGSLF